MERRNYIKPALGFGMHLVMDGYGSERHLLEDINLLYDFLSLFPEKIGMNKIMPPYVFRYTGGKPEDWGLSGFVLIAESHISIHTFPEKSFLSLDVFSCKEFDADRVISYVSKLFDVDKHEVKVFDRGVEFPNHIRSAAQVTTSDRIRLIKE